MRRVRLPAALAVTLAATLVATGVGPVAAQPVLQASTREPRAYGYQVGDRLQREVLIEVPAGLALDEASLPHPGGRGQAIELRALRLQREARPGGERQRLWLDYQVFLAPQAVRTLEIAPLTLRYTGVPREQSLRIDAWPVTVAPLLPLAVSPRRGLGELQPDAPAALVDTAGPRQRLRWWAALAGGLAAWLALAQWAWPAWLRRRGPFGQAWAALRRLPDAPEAVQWQAACRALHQALDRSAGQVVFEPGLDGALARCPALQPLRGELARFLAQSRAVFFAPGGAAGPRDGAWLRALARRCAHAERGG